MRRELENYLLTHQDIGSGTRFFKTLDDDDGQPCIRTWAVNKTKSRGTKVKEVVREYLDGEIKVHGDLYFYNMCGWKVLWEKKRANWFYYSPEPDDTWYSWDKAPGMSAISLYTTEEVNRIFGKYIPYFQLKDNVNVMEYAMRYRDYSSAELLAKAGYDYLVMDKRVLKLSKQGKKKLIHWLMQDGNGDYVKEHRPIYNIIANAMNRNISIKQYYYEEAIDNYEKTFAQHEIKRTRSECEEVYRYLNSAKRPQLLGLRDYIDYLLMAKAAGYDMTLKSTIYPLNLQEAHDNFLRREKREQNKKLNNAIRQASKILSKYKIRNKDLRIVFPKSIYDFGKWGKELHICVGTFGYDKKMAKGDCIICVVYCGDKPLECCELQKKGKSNKLQIVQLRAEHNKQSPRHDECEELVNKFISKYKNQHVIGACL